MPPVCLLRDPSPSDCRRAVFFVSPKKRRNSFFIDFNEHIAEEIHKGLPDSGRPFIFFHASSIFSHSPIYEASPRKPLQ